MAWLTTAWTPPNMTTLVGIAHRGWSGKICGLSHLRVTFLSFFFFLLSSARAQVAFLDRSARSTRQNACFRPRMCLSVCDAVTFESLHIESLFLVCRYIFRMCRPCFYIRVISQGQGRRSKNMSVYSIRGDLLSTERQSCFTVGCFICCKSV